VERLAQAEKVFKKHGINRNFKADILGLIHAFRETYPQYYSTFSPKKREFYDVFAEEENI
jgi:hypothetical protein